MTTVRPSRTVLVTGASSGIGRAVAHRLSDRGDSLVLLSRSSEVLEVVRRECLARGASQVEVAAADVGDAAAVEGVVDAAVARSGRLDGVVHAAAVLAYGRFTQIPVDVFDRVIRTDVLGTANVARSALRVFEEQQAGSLVVLGSVLGKIATPTMSPYCTSKWAVHGLVRTLQIEARRTPGVGISLVSPGGVNTPVYDQAGSYTGHPGHPPPPVSSADRVAARVVAALDAPRRESGVGPANPVMVLGSRLLPGVFDRAVGPLMSLLGQSRARVGPHPGNVLEPRPDGEAVRGRWPHLWG
jgi:NAD(P)-dependent dehydrogenase (short-subunit alcohol dehydrogenase family)